YVLTNGPESRELSESKLSLRYKLLQPLTLNIAARAGNKIYISDAFTTRNYYIPFYTVEPKLTFISGSRYRVSVLYAYQQSANAESIETLKGNKVTADVRYNVVTKSTITAAISFVEIAFKGTEDSPVGYAMLEGLKNGSNILWNVNFDRRLSQILQLTIAYEGRKTGTADIVHIGRLQMRAIF
ncbi:MAG: hypothetical protein ACK4IY_10405, partial [Chitinophagales bacterium]